MLETETWRVIDILIECTHSYKNPMLDVDVTGEFTGPNGETLTLLGFWNGGDQWIIRFSPACAGTWSYKTCASDGNVGFETAGMVACKPYAGPHDIYKHGFLKVGPQARYLAHADGTPFFWLGDTHWTFITEEKYDESNCPLYESQFKACVDKRVEQKFTVYQSNFRDGKDPGMFGLNHEYLLETEHGLMPSFEFFNTNIEPKMQYIADAGLVNAVGFAWGTEIFNGGVERYRPLAKYLVARYGAYPIIWTLAGEVPGYSPDQSKPMEDMWREVALEVERWDGYHNLQSVHLATDRPFPAIYQGEKWYDFAMSQAGHGDFDMYYNMYSDFRRDHPACPLVESEGFYEGARSTELYPRTMTPYMIRRLAYSNLQCGGCGYTYGCNGVWELQWEAGVGGIGWGDMAWWDGLMLPGANQMTLFREFYESVQWHTLRPIDFLTGDRSKGGVLNLRGQALFTANDDMSTVVGYFSASSMRAATVTTLQYSSYLVRWFDPETGEYTVLDEDARPVEGRWSLPMPRMNFAAMLRAERKDALLVMTANI
ncbi:MAG: DUF4038 domain-containing protein [Oscillospiraceae bacterium]|jgi:hypothetical protein|nr:DUF4038 domain-containing protein [Oscillospiraceae bacterium]